MNNRKKADEIAALRGKRWSPDDARRVLAACAGAGQTLAAFAREHGLHEQRLSWWRSRLRKIEEGRVASVAPLVRLVPAIVRAPGGVDGTVVMRTGGVAVKITQASAEWVAALVRGVTEARP